jgi:hypothetical protein
VGKVDFSQCYNFWLPCRIKNLNQRNLISFYFLQIVWKAFLFVHIKIEAIQFYTQVIVVFRPPAPYCLVCPVQT